MQENKVVKFPLATSICRKNGVAKIDEDALRRFFPNTLKRYPGIMSFLSHLAPGSHTSAIYVACRWPRQGQISTSESVSKKSVLRRRLVVLYNLKRTKQDDFLKSFLQNGDCSSRQPYFCNLNSSLLMASARPSIDEPINETRRSKMSDLCYL